MAKRTHHQVIVQLCIYMQLAMTSCVQQAPDEVPRILLFNGTGTSPNDVKAIATILRDNDLDFYAVNSEQLNKMSESQLSRYKLLIVPGGNYITIGENLTTAAAMNIQNSVKGGLNYLGICAGAFLAGDTGSNGLNLTMGVRFDFYAEVNRGIHKAAVPVSGADGSTIEHYWEDGPRLTGWGDVIARYPDGTPAIVQGMCGKGWVVLSGPHPEAPENWRRGMAFATPAEVSHALAVRLIEAALNRTELPHY